MPDNRIHIAHVIHRFSTGGLENGVVNLINHLGEEDYRHSIITMKGHDPDFASRIKSSNVEYHNLEKKDGNDPAVFLRLNSILRRLKPDVLHTRNTATLECQLVGWWRRIPLRIHGEHGWDVNDMHGTNKTYQRLRRAIKPFVHQYIALSSEARDYLLSIIKVPAQRVNHICNGVDDKKFKPTAQRDNSELVFGCVGRLEKVKNHQLLAHAFANLTELSGDQPKVKLHLIGEGSCRDEVESIFNQHACTEQVWMPGSRDDIAELMPQFDVFVLPSLAEGISNTILEAMSCGVAVIATDVGGNAELVEEGQSGFLVDETSPEQMVKRMLEYVEVDGLSEQHGLKGRSLVEQKFSIQAMTKSYDTLYRSVKK